MALPAGRRDKACEQEFPGRERGGREALRHALDLFQDNQRT